MNSKTKAIVVNYNYSEIKPDSIIIMYKKQLPAKTPTI